MSAIFPVSSGAYRVARAVLAVTGILLLTAMYTPVADWLALPLIKVPVESRSDAIVLLTAWSSPDGLLNTSGVRRTMQAAALYETRIADTIVVSGRNHGNGAGPTARLMRDLLVKLHVPPEAVVLETESTNTHTSAVNVAKIAAERGWSLVTLVSDSTHMRRALAAFKHEGLDALPGGDARLDLRTAPGPYRLLQFEGIAYEWLGLAYYRWKRWI